MDDSRGRHAEKGRPMSRYELLEALNPVPETRGDPGPMQTPTPRTRRPARLRRTVIVATACGVGLLAALASSALRDTEPVQVEIADKPAQATAGAAQPTATVEPAQVLADEPDAAHQLELARMSVDLTIRCLTEGGMDVIGPWPSVEATGDGFVEQPTPEEEGVPEHRVGVSDRCTRKFHLGELADPVLTSQLRELLRAEQAAFLNCLSSTVDSDARTATAPPNQPAADFAAEIDELARTAPNIFHRCSDRVSRPMPVDYWLARIVIPTIGVDLVVREGVDAETLRAPVAGHYLSTEYPGQSGNAGIAAHRTTYGAPFLRLDNLAIDDSILMTTEQGDFEYLVTSVAVTDATDEAILDDFGDNRLTLTTEHPKYSTRQRLVVVAELVGEPAPSISFVEMQAVAEPPESED